MKINVGSKNKTKIAGVKDAVRLYPDLFPDPEVAGIEVQIELHGHPNNLKRTIEGAVARAKEAFIDCDYSFGLEGGLLEVPLTTTGFMEISACAIYDGEKIYLGLSPAFEWPTAVTKLIVEGKADSSQAFKQLGLTDHEKLGAADGGIVGFLTRGRLTREEQVRQSVLMALIQIENPHLY